VFKRKGADLLIEKEISLLESLCGCDFAIDFLDGSKLRIKSKSGDVIKPDTLMTVEDKGMPFHKNPYKFGNLFILFKVKFPETMNEKQISEVNTVLKDQTKARPDADMDCEVVTL